MTNTVTDEQIDDILTTAFEGGITYWCSEATVVGEWPEGAEWASHAVSRGADVALTHLDVSDDDAPVHTSRLTKDMIVKGVREAADYRKQTVEGFYESHDADDADLAVQFALFGKVIFG